MDLWHSCQQGSHPSELNPFESESNLNHPSFLGEGAGGTSPGDLGKNVRFSESDHISTVKPVPTRQTQFCMMSLPILVKISAFKHNF